MEKVLEEANKAFMHNEHLGYVPTCPSTLSALASVPRQVKMPLMFACPDFKDYLKSARLQARKLELNLQAVHSDILGTSEFKLLVFDASIA